MAEPAIPAIIQARMSSSRFPGKVLAPFAGRPLISHVVTQVAKGVPRDQIIVATSTSPADDPLAAYLREERIRVVRGPLDDVFERFRLCVAQHPCAWFYRVCADSPFLDAELFETMRARKTADVDLVSNVFPRTYPKGQSLELVNVETFVRLDDSRLTPDQREHVTKVFYDNPSRFRIVNVSSGNPALTASSVAVDTLDDLQMLEQRGR